MATLTVGTGQQYTTIAAAVAATHDGDTVLVSAGTYLNDFFDIKTKITLQSVGGLAIIQATVQPNNGKGAIVVDNDATIDGFGVTGVTVGDGNGAGIRYDGGQLTIKNSVLWANQDGLLANADPNGNILIQNSEFSDNGAGDGYTHNIYVNAVASLTIQGSYFHDAQVGHEIKSRALVTTITGNRIQDNTTGTASYDIDLPDGGQATITGNTIEKGPDASNVFAIHYGGEGGPYAGSSLTISGNTILNDNPAGTLLLNQTSLTAQLTNNQLYGFAATNIAQGPVAQSGNTTLTTEPVLSLATRAPTVLPPVVTAPVTTPDPSIGTKLTNFGPSGAVVPSGRILTVGAKGEFSSLQSAVAASRDGDTIEVAAGTYVNDFGVVDHKITIEGVGGIARLVQSNDLLQQTGILVVNADVTLKNLEITGASSYHGYEAGILVNAGNVTIDNSDIHDNEIGLVAADNATTTVSVYNSEFGNNGNPARGTNNFQVGAIESLTIQGSYIHGANSGHEVVDHAFNTDIEGSRIIDGPGIASSFLIDLGQGGNALIAGNELVKGTDAANGVLIHVGNEGATYGNSNVEITGNTLVSQIVNYSHPYTYFVVGDAGATNNVGDAGATNNVGDAGATNNVGDAGATNNVGDAGAALAPISVDHNVFVGGVAGSRELTNATGSGNTTAPSAPIVTAAPWTTAAAPPLFAAPTGPATLTLRLSEVKGDTDSQFIVTVDGQAAGGGVVTAAASGTAQVFNLQGAWSAGQHAVAITFLNPQTGQGGGAYGLDVDSVTLGGSGISPQQQLSGYQPGWAATLSYTDPLPEFDAAYYLAHNPDVAAAGVDPLLHYETEGWKEGRDPSALFDTDYYLKQNPDVAAAGIDPLQHYAMYGWKEGRDPSLLFSDSKYLETYTDVAAAGVDPLAHYIEHGKSEGRVAFLVGGAAPVDPLVNASLYDAQLDASLMPTGIAAAQQAAASYQTAGWVQGLNPSAWFDTHYYESHNPDVAAAHVDPLLHYETFGWKEGRDPSATFSTDKYLNAYADVRAADVDPLLHFVGYGQSEGRQAFAV